MILSLYTIFKYMFLYIIIHLNFTSLNYIIYILLFEGSPRVSIHRAIDTLILQLILTLYFHSTLEVKPKDRRMLEMIVDRID
jgi:hypothetical protein